MGMHGLKRKLESRDHPTEPVRYNVAKHLRREVHKRRRRSSQTLERHPPLQAHVPSLDRPGLIAVLEWHQFTWDPRADSDRMRDWLKSLRKAAAGTGWTDDWKNGDLLTSMAIDILRQRGKGVPALLDEFREAVETFHRYNGPTAWRLDQCSSGDSP